MAGVGSAHGERTVIGLHDAVAVIAVPEAEHAPFPATGLSRHLAGERAIEYVGVEFPPTIHLENTARGTGAEESEIQLRTVEDILNAIQTSPDVREAEIADEPLRDAVALERGQCGVLGRDFGSVDELHAAQFERLPGYAAQLIEPYIYPCFAKSIAALVLRPLAAK